MRPIIKWTGGKRKEISLFKKYYPDEYDTYVEPFVGGGATYFDLEYQGRNVISDNHEGLINFYKNIKSGKGEKIYERCKNPWHHLFRSRKQEENLDLPEGFDPISERAYYYVRDEYRPRNKMEEAFQFYFLRKACYRGMLRYGPGGKFNIPYGRYKKLNFDDLLNPSYEDMLKRTTIKNCSFEQMFETYGKKKGAFFFLDPPYDTKFSNYKNSFGKQEHILLADYIKNSKSKCLLIIGKSKLTDRLYDGMIVDQYDKKYAFKLHSNRVGDEINNVHYVISNY